MLYIGIDIASKKHDCCILSENAELLSPVFSFENSAIGYELFLKTVRTHCRDFKSVKIGLEATGHYSNNLIAFLHGKGFKLTVFNPLQVNLYRKALTLRKTKTDKADARFLAHMLISSEQNTYAPQMPEISELKALVRHRFRLVAMRSKLKISISRFVDILFPELPDAFCTIHQATATSLLLEWPTAKTIAECHLTRLTNLLFKASKHRYGRDKAIQIKALAAKSIGMDSLAVGLELQQTLRILAALHEQLVILDKQIKNDVSFSTPA